MDTNQLLQSIHGASDPPDRSWTDRIWLGSFSDALHVRCPHNVQAVIAVTPSTVKQRQEPILSLVAVARFRNPFAIIERLSLVLDDTVVLTGVIPIIHPIVARQIASLPGDNTWLRKLIRWGVVVYGV